MGESSGRWTSELLCTFRLVVGWVI